MERGCLETGLEYVLPLLCLMHGLSNFSVVLFPNSPSPWAVDEEEVALEGELHTLQAVLGEMVGPVAELK
jgi:hypothetical protein